MFGVPCWSAELLAQQWEGSGGSKLLFLRLRGVDEAGHVTQLGCSTRDHAWRLSTCQGCFLALLPIHPDTGVPLHLVRALMLNAQLWCMPPTPGAFCGGQPASIDMCGSPLAVDAASKDFRFYAGGIFSNPDCKLKPSQLDHAVVLRCGPRLWRHVAALPHQTRSQAKQQSRAPVERQCLRW
jgi:hypothetical protein